MTPPSNRRPSGGSGAPSGRGPKAGSGQRRRGPRGRQQPERGTTGRTRPGQPDLAPPEPTGPQIDVHDPKGTRLQKVLAAAGIGSRRACEELITDGRVMVDGHVVTELGVRVDPLNQTVHVDGERVQLDESRVYLAFNKPVGVVTTMSDELGRLNIGDYVAGRPERLFHVGRLDADTEGLLILTNDGDLAHRLQHPAHGVLKTYVATVRGPVGKDVGRQLRQGVELEDGPVQVDSFKVVDSQPGKALVEVVLHEGRKHVVRRMLEAVGHPVLELVRTEVGPIRLADLRSGRMRKLNK